MTASLAGQLADPSWYIPLALLLGLVVGSFLNVVIHRLPLMMERSWQAECAELRGEAVAALEPLTLATPGSHCPKCGKRIAPLENIPLLSWIVLRGRCRACAAPISLRYPLVEAVSGCLSAFAAWHFGFAWAAAGAMLFIWAMIALTAIDFDTQLLPDSITLPLLWIGLVLNLGATYTDLPGAVLGAVAGYLSLWCVYWAFKLATGKEGMGYGDFKLLGAIGAWLGWKVLPLTILLSSLVGAAVGIGLMLFNRHGRDVPIPFGPYLASAGVIALFWGKSLTESYLRLY